jgi:hypothetical protein
MPGDQAPGAQPKKRSAGASERDEWLRLVWRSTFGKLDGRRLVFVDEMGTHTSLAPLYVYAPRGKRASHKVPRNRGKNSNPFWRASAGTAWGLRWAIEGSTTKGVFESYVECFLAPVLRSGQVMVMDNLSAHKGERVKELIEERGCKLLYLPPYSPDLNPIDGAFAKVKALLRKVAARSRGALVEAMGAALDAITAQDAHGLFGHCGYRAPVQPLCQTLYR